MADINARYQLRRDTASAWASSNPILILGEPGYETDTKKLRIGDGVTAFTSLPYYISASATSLVSATDLGRLAGVTSGVQDQLNGVQAQLNGKAPLASPILSSATLGGPTKITGGAADWTIQATTSNLIFYYNGVAKFRLQSDGTFIATNNIQAFGVA